MPKHRIDLARIIIILFINSAFGKNSFMQLLSNNDQYSQITFITSSSSSSAAAASAVSGVENSTLNSFDIVNHNNGTTSIYHKPNEEPTVSFDSFDKMTTNGLLILNTSNLDFLLTYEDSHITYEDVDQWTLVSIDDFQGDAQGWSMQALSTCGTNNNMFLGGHCNFGGIDVSKKFTGLKKHSMVRITANYHFFDQWEGEDAYMKFNNQTVWFENYIWCDKVLTWKCKKYGINACGADYPDRLGVPIDFTIYHSNNEFDLTFGSSLTKSPCIASWGIDDVSVYIR